MIPRTMTACLLATLLSACAASAPEMKMTPASAPGVGVRFSRGQALMVSAGDAGAVALFPVRYNQSSGKALFRIAGYNRSGIPINFGAENVSITLDNGISMPIYDFDTVRHGLRAEAEQQRMYALIEGAANMLAASVAYRHDHALGRAMLRDAADQYDFELHSIGENLRHNVQAADMLVLQTTTIDPGTYWEGWIIVDQPPLAAGEVREMTATVEFAGDRHQFRLFLAPEGTPTPTEVSLPAVTRADGKGLLNTPATWLWDAPAVRERETCHEMRGVRFCPGPVSYARP